MFLGSLRQPLPLRIVILRFTFMTLHSALMMRSPSHSSSLHPPDILQVPWRQNEDKYGPQPRLTAWYGPHSYTYSQLTLPSSPEVPCFSV